MFNYQPKGNCESHKDLDFSICPDPADGEITDAFEPPLGALNKERNEEDRMEGRAFCITFPVP